MYNTYNEIFFKGLELFALREEISDIKNRHKHTSKFANDFAAKNRRVPTDQECEDRIKLLETELEVLSGC